jgi:hypothetical protein
MARASAIVGNSAWNRWNKKYLTDEYGAYIMEPYEIVKWEGHEYEHDKIPVDVTVPDTGVEHVTVDDDGNSLVRRKLNPEYDPDIPYIPREDRPEWVVVGLLGQIQVAKGQVVGDRWIKLRDISATVEEWVVR